LKKKRGAVKKAKGVQLRRVLHKIYNREIFWRKGERGGHVKREKEEGVIWEAVSHFHWSRPGGKNLGKKKPKKRESGARGRALGADWLRGRQQEDDTIDDFENREISALKKFT